ncbi:YbhB/YbcL family Raf kinase inhibitor-like protein [bacterium]|nr:YbhB/YbcL family Raf kinase inhibitor-like protein [bacterium]
MKTIFSLFVFTITMSVGAADLKVESKSIKEAQPINNIYVFNGFGCSGQNKSPHLKWSPGPKGTKFYAVSAYDPDAPTGSGWWHWVMINIPANVTELPEGASGSNLPQGAVETRTDFAKQGYGGPCPPVGDKPHRYFFKVFALKDKVPVESDAPGAMAGYYMNSLKIAEGQIMGIYSR